MTDFYSYRILPAGEIMPEGWIKSQLTADLKKGYIGKFDRVHPTVTHDVFLKQDRRSKRRLSLRKEWWSGEHEGYWKDAVVRMAFLTGDSEFRDLSRRWMEDLLTHQGKDGYIGIYEECEEPNCRFRHTKGNGELWTTSRILMAMLAYFEFTGERRILESAISAARLVMGQYRERNYFQASSSGGGVSHGVGFFEILEWLYRITGEQEYLDFALKLYGDFNRGDFRDDDLKTGRLLDEKRLFRKHGAHIAEGMFVPEFIATVSGDPSHRNAAALALDKLKMHLTPGGAMRSDEWIKGRKGTADERYEYCSIAEMVSPLNKIHTLGGDPEMADMTERMTFNAGQGARFPVLSALSYLTTDNRIRINHLELIRRETYDAAHFAAACCVLNGGRLMPYYVEGMWLKHPDGKGIYAAMYGPSRVRTQINGVAVEIREMTDYPFSDRIRFEFSPEKPVAFTFTLRKPHGCRSADISKPEGARREDTGRLITLSHTWKKGEVVEVTFPFDVEKVSQPSSSSVKEKGVYFSRGPLVYSLPFEHRIVSQKEYGESGHHRYRIKVSGKNGWEYRCPRDGSFEFLPLQEDGIKDPWARKTVSLAGDLVDKKDQPVPVELVPMGATLFRRVTFPVATEVYLYSK